MVMQLPAIAWQLHRFLYNRGIGDIPNNDIGDGNIPIAYVVIGVVV